MLKKLLRQYDAAFIRTLIKFLWIKGNHLWKQNKMNLIFFHTKEITMKPRFLIALSVAVLLSFTCLGSPVKGINANVLRSFHSLFANARNVEWFTYPSYYYVSFKEDNFIVRAYYDKNGSLMNTIRYYNGQFLPLNIIYKLKERYPHKAIKHVTEVSNGNAVVYFVRLDDAKTWRIVKLDEDGYITTVTKFDKGV